jgi:hypothetical protein
MSHDRQPPPPFRPRGTTPGRPRDTRVPRPASLVEVLDFLTATPTLAVIAAAALVVLIVLL